VKTVSVKTVSGTVFRSPRVPQGVLQVKLRRRLGHPLLRAIRLAAFEGIADILNFFLALRLVGWGTGKAEKVSGTFFLRGRKGGKGVSTFLFGRRKRWAEKVSGTFFFGEKGKGVRYLFFHPDLGNPDDARLLRGFQFGENGENGVRYRFLARRSPRWYRSRFCNREPTLKPRSSLVQKT